MKGYFKAGMNHCFSSQRFLSISRFWIFPLSFPFTYMYVCMYLLFLLHLSQTQSKAKKYIYVYVLQAKHCEFHNSNQATILPFYHTSQEMIWENMGCHYFSLCIIGQVHICFISLVCELITMILSEGWLMFNILEQV